MRPQQPSPEKCSPRRASAYALVLMTSMLVVVIGLAALTAARVESRTSLELERGVRARQLARSAVELGMFMARANPNWRTEFGEGVWKNWAALGDGRIRIEGHDPIDGDPADDPNDPIVIKAIARVDDATQAIEATLDAARVSELLEVAAHASSDVNLTAGTLRASNYVSTNTDVYASSGANYYTDVYAAGSLQGATYHGAQLAGQEPRSAIPIATLMGVYGAMATPISIGSIPAGNANKIVNPGFESGAAGWSAVGTLTTITLDGSRRRNGSFSLLVAGRIAAADGVEQNVASALRNQKPFAATAYLRRFGGNDIPARLQLVISYSPTPGATAVSTTYTGTTTTVGGGFNAVSASFTPSWTGTLVSAKLRINSASGNESFYVDDVSLARSDLSSDPYLDGVVLSATSNPYGAGNASGVYLINCGNQNLHISNCRIHGTLVLLSPGAGTIVEQSVAWRPYVSNYPILVSNAGLLISMTNTPLCESNINANFNPPTAPATDEGLGSDFDLYDSYMSQLRGLIVLGGNSTLAGYNDIFGVLLCDGTLSIGATRTDITYDVRYLSDPPPGLNSSSHTLQFRRGSFKQSVD